MYASIFTWLCVLLSIYNTDSTVPPSLSNSTFEYYESSLSNVSFATNNIICNTATCIIICNNYNGCNGLIINASLSSVLSLHCIANQSCYSTQLIDGPQSNAIINCLDDASCKYGSFNLKHTTNVYIQCNYINCSSTCDKLMASCGDAVFDMSFSNNVSVECIGNTLTRDCSGAVFNVSNADHAMFTIDNSRYSALNAKIIGTNMQSNLTIYCLNDRSCYNTAIYCPISSFCNILCNAIYGCYLSDIYIDTVDTSYLNLVCSDSNSCDQMTFTCEDSGYVTDYIYSETSMDYICLTDGCCISDNPFTHSIITCTTGSNCVIDCSSDVNGRECAYKTTINGNLADSLTVHCSSSYECQFVYVICPMNGICVINCDGTSSCEWMTIMNSTIIDYQIASLTLNCILSYSCQYIKIEEIIITDFMYMECNSLHSCRYAEFHNIMIGNSIDFICNARYSCYRGIWKINGIDRNADITINGNIEYSFYYTNFYIHNVDTINVLINNGENLGFGSNWILDANYIQFQCGNDPSCAGMDINANINNSLTFISSNETLTLEDIEFTNLNIYCVFEDCVNVFYCMNNVTIYCGINHHLYSTGNTTQCINCLCDINSNQNDIFIALYDGVWSQCPTMYPTVSPFTPLTTLNPTPIIIVNTTEIALDNTYATSSIQETESYGVDNKNENNDKDFILYVVIGGTVVLCLCVLLGILFLRKYKKANKVKDTSNINASIEMQQPIPVIPLKNDYKATPKPPARLLPKQKVFKKSFNEEMYDHDNVETTFQTKQTKQITDDRNNKNNDQDKNEFVVHGLSVYNANGMRTKGNSYFEQNRHQNDQIGERNVSIMSEGDDNNIHHNIGQTKY